MSQSQGLSHVGVSRHCVPIIVQVDLEISNAPLAQLFGAQDTPMSNSMTTGFPIGSDLQVPEPPLCWRRFHLGVGLFVDDVEQVEMLKMLSHSVGFLTCFW